MVTRWVTKARFKRAVLMFSSLKSLFALVLHRAQHGLLLTAAPVTLRAHIVNKGAAAAETSVAQPNASD
jgi:hypothetical protein